MQSEVKLSSLSNLLEEVRWLRDREGKSRNILEYQEQIPPSLNLAALSYGISIGYLERLLMKLCQAHAEKDQLDEVEVSDWAEG